MTIDKPTCKHCGAKHWPKQACKPGWPGPECAEDWAKRLNRIPLEIEKTQ